MATSTINHGDIHHQSTVTLHHIGALAQLKADGNLFAYSVSTENPDDLILYHSQGNATMDFLLDGDGENGGSSRESITNLLDEGLGTSLDGTDEISSSIHSTLGRNDSGVFSSDDTTSPNGLNSISIGNITTSTTTSTTTTNSTTQPNSIDSPQKKHRPKNASPNRQGPQRCAICGKIFSNASALTKHKLTHSDERKHACSMCGKAFKRQDHLNGHMLTHRNKKPFECTAKGCGKSYCDARSLRRHIESRHGHEALATLTIAPTSSTASVTVSSLAGTQVGPAHAPVQVRKQSHNSHPVQIQTSSLALPQATAVTNVANSLPLVVTENIVVNSDNILENDVVSCSSVLGIDASLLDTSFGTPLQMEVEIEGATLEEKHHIKDAGDGKNMIGSTTAVISCVKDEIKLNNAPIHIRSASQSQLHQLLTQRASNASSAVVSLTPGVVNKRLESGSANSYGSNWATNESEMTKCGTTGGNSESIVAGGGKCPSSPISSSSSSPTPTLLKEQLELIHQIIQQAQEESSSATTKTSTKVSTKKSKSSSSSAAPTSAAITVKFEPTGEDANKSGSEEKPVECTICCRRFKNTPALNGHMRLHGGYFKKDADGKKKDQSSKESSSTPLQTASVSVRALIEEKIIQKRNTINIQGGGIEKNSVVGSVNQVPSSESQNGFLESQVEVSSQDGLTISLQQGNPLAVSLSPTFTTSQTQNHAQTASQTFQFVYGEDNTDYLLMEEEVFNKVSSICPDSFFNGIDESILSGATGAENEQLAPEWSWAATSAGVDSVNSRLNSLFSTNSNSDNFSKPASTSSNGGNPFTPLPPLDPVFYTSPTPQSPLNSQDSPSFIYPTPPASLESHNALQSPLFPFPSVPSTNVVFPFETQTQASVANTLMTCSGTNLNSAEMDTTSTCSSTSSLGSMSISTTSSVTAATNTHANISSLLSNKLNIMANCTTLALNTSSSSSSSSSGNVIATTIPTPSPTSHITKNTTNIRHFGSVKARNHSGGSTSDLNILTPSSSPSLGSSSAEDSVQSMKELKVNEPSRMDCSSVEEDVFLSPNSVPSSPCIKLTKRKQLRNTFASNLRPQTVHSSSSNSHFTPYPILSPVRSAPGLYWTFSQKLSHVDDSKKEQPRINIGLNFQASLPPCRSVDKGNKVVETEREDRLWEPGVMAFCTPEEVDKYLEFACCSAIPGGGRNKEYALHLLSLCHGDINSAIILLMNREPPLPLFLKRYKYQEKEKWSRVEIHSFQDALLRHGKDFIQVAKEVRTKNSEECVIFYQLWKKVCANEYERVRNVWKKRDAAFTLDLLKNVPPPPTNSRVLSATPTLNLDITEPKRNKVNSRVPDSSSPISDITSGHTSNEEFPCKVCGKIFNKVKSRSAHMKSHRPPEPCETTKKNKILGIPTSGSFGFFNNCPPSPIRNQTPKKPTIKKDT